MLKTVRARLTYANVMATLAVFLGLAGGAYALSGVPDGSGVYRACVEEKSGAVRVVESLEQTKVLGLGRNVTSVPRRPLPSPTTFSGATGSPSWKRM